MTIKWYFILCVILIYIIKEVRCDVQEINLPYEGKIYKFNLTNLKHKVFNDVPVWTVGRNPGDDLQYTYEGIIKSNGVMYEDTAMKAIFFKKNHCSSNCWEGVFGFGTKRNVINYRRQSRSRSHTAPKIITGIYRSYSINATVKSKNLNIKKSVINIDSQVNYLKLLLIIDNAFYKKLDSSLQYATKYLSIFWSSVDLQYRNITFPKIEVRIAGLIIAKDDKALNYVSKNSPDGVSLNLDEALMSLSNDTSFIKNTNLTNYNAIVTMTSLNGFSQIGSFKIGSSGATFNATACIEDYGASVMVDDGMYLGIHSAAHEIAHLMGVDHDAEPGNGLHCFPKDRRRELTVMWPRFEVRDSVYWSECSLKALKIFLSDQKESWCLKSE